MKPHKNIFAQIVDFENIYRAYRDATAGKRYRTEILKFTDNLEENLYDIRRELIAETYATGKYREFYVREPKKRLVMALPFRDRVVQWAIYRVVNPLFSKGYITDSYACIDGRGVHHAVKRLHYWAQQTHGAGYYLKLDISKYFYRIDHDVLLHIIRRKFDDPPLMRLFERIIRSRDIPFGLPDGASPGDGAARIFNRGMPIGNLTSQMFANLYLNELDQFIKRDLRARHYCRYMDDMAILADSKAELHAFHDRINAFVSERLKLSLNDKTTIRPLKQGLEFCGFRVWATHTKIRKSSALKMKHRLKKLMAQYAAGEIDYDGAARILAAYKGVLAHSNSYALRNAIYGDWRKDGGAGGGWFYLRRDNQNDG
ncbi:hypothetical protein FACS18949_02950 [Clostridia bacterium]|nr:hypothetical protein FACS18949_02950 [Clostridia bacterium]